MVVNPRPFDKGGPPCGPRELRRRCRRRGAGFASGLMTIAHEVGAAFGVAIFSAVALGSAAAGTAFVRGYGNGALAGALIAIGLAVFNAEVFAGLERPVGVKQVGHGRGVAGLPPRFLASWSLPLSKMPLAFCRLLPYDSIDIVNSAARRGRANRWPPPITRCKRWVCFAPRRWPPVASRRRMYRTAEGANYTYTTGRGCASLRTGRLPAPADS